jgi:hypothetical protein
MAVRATARRDEASSAKSCCAPHYRECCRAIANAPAFLTCQTIRGDSGSLPVLA